MGKGSFSALQEADWTDIAGYGFENRTYVFGDFEYNDTKDEGEIELRIQVPLGEPEGAKSSIITITGER